MISLKELLSDYQAKHFALPAFNIDSFEIYQAVEIAVRETGLPCIVQLSTGEDNFIQAERLLMLVRKANKEGLPIYLNMDHGNNIERLFSLARHGWDMVHFDGSKMDFQLNLATTKILIDQLKSANLNTLIEVEFNPLTPDSQTSPQEAKEFIDATSADLLAVSIGNIHGVDQLAPEHINISLLSEIKNTLPNTFFTLHGGSGISFDQVKLAINQGVVKININTDLRLKFLSSLKNQITINHTEKIYEILKPVIDDVTQVVKEKLTLFVSP